MVRFGNYKSLLLIGVILSASLALVFAQDVSAHKSGFRTNMDPDFDGAVLDIPDWMAQLPDDATIVSLSIPGTHDTMANVGIELARTQAMSLEEQLDSGIRHFDIRSSYGTFSQAGFVNCEVRHVFPPNLLQDCKFHTFHGPIALGTTLEDDVWPVFLKFLNDHPSETIIMSNRGAGPTDRDPEYPDKMNETFFEYYVKLGGKYIDRACVGDIIRDQGFKAWIEPNTSRTKIAILWDETVDSPSIVATAGNPFTLEGTPITVMSTSPLLVNANGDTYQLLTLSAPLPPFDGSLITISYDADATNGNIVFENDPSITSDDVTVGDIDNISVSRYSIFKDIKLGPEPTDLTSNGGCDARGKLIMFFDGWGCVLEKNCDVYTLGKKSNKDPYYIDENTHNEYQICTNKGLYSNWVETWDNLINTVHADTTSDTFYETNLARSSFLGSDIEDKCYDQGKAWQLIIPNFAASGHSDVYFDDSPHLWTGLIIENIPEGSGGDDNKFRDFPRYSCTVKNAGHCSTLYEGLNLLTERCLRGSYISEDSWYWNYGERICGNTQVVGRLGVVTSDFPGPYLIGAIINSNVDKNGTPLDVLAPNNPPTASIVKPEPVDEGSEIEFDGSGSSDPDSDSLSYEWNIDLPNCQVNEIKIIRDYNAKLDTWYKNHPDYNPNNPPAPDLIIEFESTTQGKDAKDAIIAASPLAQYLSITCPDGYVKGTVTLKVSDGTFEDETSENFEILNVAPEITMSTSGQTINEGGDSSSRDGSFTDPGSDTWSATVDYGDGGGPQDLTLNDDKTFSIPSHTYGDDGKFTVTVEIEDDDGGKDTTSFKVTVNNVVPSLPITNADSADENQSIGFSGSITDPGSDDVFISWDWDDGTANDTEDYYLVDSTSPDGFPTPSIDPRTIPVSPDHTWGDDGEYDIEVCIWDDDMVRTSADKSCQTVTVTINNVLPTIENTTSNPNPQDENSSVDFTARVTDPGSDDLFVSWDWDDNTTNNTEDYYLVDSNNPDGLPTPSIDPRDETDTQTHTWGDNYDSYSVEFCVWDDDMKRDASFSDDDKVCTIISVKIDNVNPTAEIDETDTLSIQGTPTFIGQINTQMDFTGYSKDPGSEDITFTWDWDDDSSDSVETHYLVDSGNPDGLPSPSINSRDLTDYKTKTWTDACLYVVNLDTEDDDSGTGNDYTSVVIVGNSESNYGAGYWQSTVEKLLSGKGKPKVDQETMVCYLDIASHMSAIYDEKIPLSTLSESSNVFNDDDGSMSLFEQLDRQILAAWINFANGGVGLDDLVDTTGDKIGDTVFSDAISTAESVRINPASSILNLETQKEKIEYINLMD